MPSYYEEPGDCKDCGKALSLVHINRGDQPHTWRYACLCKDKPGLSATIYRLLKMCGVQDPIGTVNSDPKIREHVDYIMENYMKGLQANNGMPGEGG